MRPSLAFGFVIFASALSVAVLFLVFGAFSASSPLRQAFMATAIGGLFILAAVLISGSLRLETLTELQGLAAHYGLDQSGGVHDLRRRILLHLWREQSGGGRVDPFVGVHGQDLIDDPTGAPSPFSTDPLMSFDHEVPQQLVKEGKYLLALARLFKVDVGPYGRILAKAHRAAQAGRVEEWIQVMQSGNEQLRARLEVPTSEE